MKNQFRANVRRDAAHEALWREEGWGVIVLWTCGLEGKRLDETLDWLSRTLGKWSRPRPECGQCGDWN